MGGGVSRESNASSAPVPSTLSVFDLSASFCQSCESKDHILSPREPRWIATLDHSPHPYGAQLSISKPDQEIASGAEKLHSALPIDQHQGNFWSPDLTDFSSAYRRSQEHSWKIAKEEPSQAHAGEDALLLILDALHEQDHEVPSQRRPSFRDMSPPGHPRAVRWSPTVSGVGRGKGSGTRGSKPYKSTILREAQQSTAASDYRSSPSLSDQPRSCSASLRLRSPHASTRPGASVSIDDSTQIMLRRVQLPTPIPPARPRVLSVRKVLINFLHPPLTFNPFHESSSTPRHSIDSVRLIANAC